MNGSSKTQREHVLVKREGDVAGAHPIDSLQCDVSRTLER